MISCYPKDSAPEERGEEEETEEGQLFISAETGEKGRSRSDLG